MLTPLLIVSLLITVVIYILIIRNIAEGDKLTAVLIAFVAVLFVLGIFLSHFFKQSGNISLLMGSNIIYIIMGVIILFAIFRLFSKKEGIERRNLLYLFPIAMLIMFSIPIVFFYFQQKGDAIAGAKIGEYLGIISVVMIMISIFGLKAEGEGKETERKRKREKFENPFRELLDFVEKKKIFLFLILVPLTYSVGHLIIYYPETPKEILLSDYRNYTVEKHETYAKIDVTLPPETDNLEVTLVVLFDRGHYERKVLVRDNITKVIYIEKVKGEYFTGIKNIFSMMGLYNFWLPMFIVFLLVYAILGKVLVISTKEGEVKELVGKDVRILIAFSIAIIFGASSWATKFVSTYLPYIGMGLVLILGIGMIISFIFPKGIAEITSNPIVKNTLLYIGFSIFLVALLFAAATVAGKSPGELMTAPVYEDLTFGDILIFGLFVGWIAVMIIPKIIELLVGGEKK